MSSLILGQLRHLHDGVSVGYLARGRVRANFGTSFLQVTHTRLRQVCSVTRGHLPGPFGGRLPAAAKIGNVKEVGRFDVDVDTSIRIVLALTLCYMRFPTSAFEKVALMVTRCCVGALWSWKSL